MDTDQHLCWMSIHIFFFRTFFSKHWKHLEKNLLDTEWPWFIGLAEAFSLLYGEVKWHHTTVNDKRKQSQHWGSGRRNVFPYVTRDSNDSAKGLFVQLGALWASIYPWTNVCWYCHIGLPENFFLHLLIHQVGPFGLYLLSCGKKCVTLRL